MIYLIAGLIALVVVIAIVAEVKKKKAEVQEQHVAVKAEPVPVVEQKVAETPAPTTKKKGAPKKATKPTKVIKTVKKAK